MSSQGGKSIYKVDDDNTNDEQNDGAAAPRTSGAGLVNRRPATQRADDPTARRGTFVIYVDVRNDDPRFIDNLRHLPHGLPG
jgi:hypothetical protein